MITHWRQTPVPPQLQRPAPPLGTFACSLSLLTAYCSALLMAAPLFG